MLKKFKKKKEVKKTKSVRLLADYKLKDDLYQIAARVTRIRCFMNPEKLSKFWQNLLLDFEQCNFSILEETQTGISFQLVN